jgi:hypothetical protein
MAREEKSQSVVVESSKYRGSENGVHHGGLFCRVRLIQIVDDMYKSRMDANLLDKTSDLLGEEFDEDV